MGFLLFCALFAVALCKRPLPPSDFKLAGRSHALQKIAFNFGLVQHNRQVLFDAVLARADPQNALYSKWMSIEEINAIVSPPAAVKDAVRAELTRNHFRVIVDGGDFFRVLASVRDVERFLNTTVHRYVNANTKRTIHRAHGYTIPASLREHVEIISGLTELPRSTLKPKKAPKTRKTNPNTEEIIPQFLRLLYGIPQNASAAGTNSSIAVIEFQDDNAYLPSDMTLFYKEMAEPAISIHNVGPISTNGGPDAESSLDIQFGGTVARGAEAYFWVDLTWMLSFAQALYARPVAPQVVSMSWGWPENGQCESGIGSCTDPQSYVERCNTEFAKIVGRGITLFSSSGDQGAPGDNHPNCGGLSDLFPTSSPWVTSVGATMLGTNQNNTLANSFASPVTAPICRSRAVSCARGDVLTEEVCTYRSGALITSGGGFSQYTSQPSWQQSSVQQYLKKQSGSLPPSSMFNGNNRAFPDISANGHSYLVELSGQPTPVDGTSCSSPVVAAMFTLINSERAKVGKKPVGFINPALYKAPASAFTDIRSGDNKCTEGCCGGYGFLAEAGWDPVTGL